MNDEETTWIPAERDPNTKVTWLNGIAHVKCSCGRQVRVDTKDFSVECAVCGREYHINFVVEARE